MTGHLLGPFALANVDGLPCFSPHAPDQANASFAMGRAFSSSTDILGAGEAPARGVKPALTVAVVE